MGFKLPKGLLHKDQIPKDAKIIDKGTVVIKDEKSDYERLLKYINALSQGDETYKPSGLEFKEKRAETPKETAINNTKKNIDYNPFMQEKRPDIKYLH